ncbi:MAG: hypothetical protein KDI01_04425 [Halioglobus sp.]|nr:hypothetical protein [Halioglobus sp.]
MTTQDDELLSQHLDGELTGPARLALRKRLLAEPRLRARFNRLQAVDEQLKKAFDTPGAAIVPAPVVQLLKGATTRPDTAVPARRYGSRRLGIAASLVAAAGLLLTAHWRQPTAPGADALLAGVLERAPSRAQGWDSLADGRQVRALLSFPDTSGHWCREYLVRQPEGTRHGVACRSDGHWHIAVLGAALPLPVDDSENYRPAGSDSSDQVASYINQHAADIPLSPHQEARLIARQWQ